MPDSGGVGQGPHQIVRSKTALWTQENAGPEEGKLCSSFSFMCFSQICTVIHLKWDIFDGGGGGVLLLLREN